MTVASFNCASWQRSSVAKPVRRVCQVPDTSREKEKYRALCRLLDRTTRANLQGLLQVSAHLSERRTGASHDQKTAYFSSSVVVGTSAVFECQRIHDGERRRLESGASSSRLVLDL